MEAFASVNGLLILAIVAGVAFLIGRASASSRPNEIGGSSPRLKKPKLSKTANAAEVTQRLAGLAPAVRAELDTLLRAGQKIHAVKLVKDSTGLGLKDSKDVVDRREDQLSSN